MIKIATVFDDIKFNPDYHTYTLNGKRLRNVTSLVKTVQQPFDRDAVAQRTAEKQNVPVEFILDEWERKGKRSIDKGNRVHTYAETVLKNGSLADDPILLLNEQIPEEEAFDKFWTRASNVLEPLDTEWIVGDAELGIAGTIDCPMRHKESNKYYLFDWKTGKLERENPWENMNEPFDDFSDCKFHRYSLQLSIYHLIVERNTDLAIAGCYLVHLKKNADYEIIKAVDLKDRVLQWIQKI